MALLSSHTRVAWLYYSTNLSIWGWKSKRLSYSGNCICNCNLEIPLCATPPRSDHPLYDTVGVVKKGVYLTLTLSATVTITMSRLSDGSSSSLTPVSSLELLFSNTLVPRSAFDELQKRDLHVSISLLATGDNRRALNSLYDLIAYIWFTLLIHFSFNMHLSGSFPLTWLPFWHNSYDL